MTAASAKIWIREGVFLATPSVDLKVDRWVDNAGKGVELAKFGLMAPEITKFEIKGALIDPFWPRSGSGQQDSGHFQHRIITDLVTRQLTTPHNRWRPVRF